jgi:hypothetical protein
MSNDDNGIGSPVIDDLRQLYRWRAEHEALVVTAWSFPFLVYILGVPLSYSNVSWSIILPACIAGTLSIGGLCHCYFRALADRDCARRIMLERRRGHAGGAVGESPPVRSNGTPQVA